MEDADIERSDAGKIALFGTDALHRYNLTESTHRQMHQMEADGLVHRKVYAEVPPRVEYSLTELGQSLALVVEAMRTWDRNDQETHPLQSKSH